MWRRAGKRKRQPLLPGGGRRSVRRIPAETRKRRRVSGRHRRHSNFRRKGCFSRETLTRRLFLAASLRRKYLPKKCHFYVFTIVPLRARVSPFGTFVVLHLVWEYFGQKLTWHAPCPFGGHFQSIDKLHFLVLSSQNLMLIYAWTFFYFYFFLLKDSDAFLLDVLSRPSISIYLIRLLENKNSMVRITWIGANEC